MITSNIIAGKSVKGSGQTFVGHNPSTLLPIDGDFEIASQENVEQAVSAAKEAFNTYKNTSGVKKAELLRTIAAEIEALGDQLIQRAMQESGLPEGRFKGERGRTIGQLKMFADLVEEGSWVDAVIDTAIPDRKPLPRVDIRNMMQALGPVVIFGASNFPLAFSTAGGDTASALAAGCPVIVKAHPSHPGTNALVSEAIATALEKCGLPAGVYSTLYDNGHTIGGALVQHPDITAVGFTGSEAGGKALMDLAAKRENPIPVYAEMGSTNPVFILPEKLNAEVDKLPAQIAFSVNMGVGQFCTNPGLLFVQENENLEQFTSNLEKEFSGLGSFTMLNDGIYKNYVSKRENALQTEGVTTVQASGTSTNTLKAPPAIAKISYQQFMENTNLHEEIFGPFTLMVVCQNKTEMLNLAHTLKGQLTSTFMGTDSDLESNTDLIDVVSQKVGRIVFNGVPTGVEVGHAMHHGGPFPASSNGRYTSVGTGAIKRFARPIAWQNCPNTLLPDALKEGNPLNIWRKVNGELTRS
ncbi:MAG: aldehyde dehydrogenase (NADP(+)) [Saprospiraceae bacterium]|nr:aldehyde dehydrogenase (NADP(+)) [Saprospiraceae bacterium]